MEPCKSIVSKHDVIINTPIYDQSCKYFNAKSGCHFGEYCYFKHIINYQPQTEYITLIQNQKRINDILRGIATTLTKLAESMTKNVTYTGKQKTEREHDYKIKNDPKLEPVIGIHSNILLPELNSDSAPRSPKPKPRKVPKTKFRKKKRKKERKRPNLLSAFTRTPTPPAPTMKVQNVQETEEPIPWTLQNML